ncbi:MAG: hypothetical protein H5T85_08400 [Actinobacteria bacterium]|nr:hypothetical protein [Actinomycetota bacterium]
MSEKDKIRDAIEKTEILKQPERLLSTFDSTTIHYYILSVPFYLEFEGRDPETETIVREGKITWQRPKLITPSYMLRVEGFSEEAKKAFQMLAMEDSDLAMILYSLRLVKESEKMEIVSYPLNSVARKLFNEIEEKKDPFSAVIKGVDEFWDVSLSKFIYELVVKSAYFSQFPDLLKKSVIDISREGFAVVRKDRYGIPIATRIEVENLFRLFEKGEISPSDLKKELDRWGVFEEYQDRFFKFFKRS